MSFKVIESHSLDTLCQANNTDCQSLGKVNQTSQGWSKIDYISQGVGKGKIKDEIW